MSKETPPASRIAAPRIAAIAAMAQNRVIGRDNDIPWHIPADLQFFKRQTMGKPVSMGRKTFESILKSLGKPMPGRHSIVVTRGDFTHPGAETCHSIEDALKAAYLYAAAHGCEEIIIGGGGQIYAQALPVTDRIYLTVVQRDYEGDALFPALPDTIWEDRSQDAHAGDPPFVIHTFERKQTNPA